MITSQSLPNFLLTLCAITICVYQPASSFQAYRRLLRPPVFSNIHSFYQTERVGTTVIFSSSNSDDEETTNYDQEEILLQIHLSALDGVSTEEAKEKVSSFTQSFPFAAVLPVQPLQYLPTEDGGVDVRFLRKKTKEKGSLDGGIRFFLSEERDGIELVAKRNSSGQTVPKMFAEKLVVQAFVKGISGEENDKTSPPPTDAVMVESVFHKWLQF